jgi:hypothetical protein
MEMQQEFDLALMEEIRTGIDDAAPDLADYLLVSEIVRITHLRHARIGYALNKGKLRPLYGIKRGDRWFVHRIDALEWAATISQDQVKRWQSNVKRIERLRKYATGDALKGAAGRLAAQSVGRAKRPEPPRGTRVYTYQEAALVLELKVTTLSEYLAPSGPLGHVARYQINGNRIGINAEAIDAFADKRRVERDREKEEQRAQRAAKRAQQQEAPVPQEGAASRKRQLKLVEKGAA